MDNNFVYAKALSDLGTRIIKISNELQDSDEKLQQKETTYEILKDRCNNFLKAMNEYEECKIFLSNIEYPQNVKIEHKQMIDAFGLFVEGTKAMANSININELSINEGLMKNGMSMQKFGEQKIVELSDEIVKKLIE